MMANEGDIEEHIQFALSTSLSGKSGDNETNHVTSSRSLTAEPFFCLFDFGVLEKDST